MASQNKMFISVVIVLAILVRVAAMIVVKPDRQPWGDAPQYISLGASLAEGRGYQLSQGNFWPGQPTMIRSPGWPLILSVPFRVIPHVWQERCAQVMAVGFDVLNAVLILILAAKVGLSRRSALIAGILYAINPVTAALAAQSCSEAPGIALLLLFVISTLCVKPSGIGRFALAGLLLGLACLIRTNWLAIAGCFGVAYLWIERRNMGRILPQLILFGFMVLLPLMPWLARNTLVFHHFPIFGAGGGETFLGGNNDLAADPKGPMWGYIVQPGGIPGELPLAMLASTMNEYEVDRYWMKRGWLWVKANPDKLPVLVVGKLRRAFVPVPYSRGPVVLLASAFRGFLYILAIAGTVLVIQRKLQVRPEVWVVFGSVAVAHVVTTIIFCGVMRYIVGFEVLLCIPASLALNRLWMKRHPQA